MKLAETQLSVFALTFFYLIFIERVLIPLICGHQSAILGGSSDFKRLRV